MKNLITFAFLFIIIDLFASRGKSGELINPISIADEINDPSVHKDSCRFNLIVIDNYTPSDKDSLLISIFHKGTNIFPNFKFFNTITDSNGLANIVHLPGKYFVKILKPCTPDFKLDFEFSIDTSGHSRTVTANITQMGTNRMIMVSKPVIYCYPEEKMQVDIQLETDVKLTFTYPIIENGWSTTLHPNGDIIVNDKKYPYLFWEGEISEKDLPTSSSGFIISSSEAIKFFEEKLAYLGLNQREITDFITFWAPKMTEDSYNVKFITDNEYNEHIGQLNYSVEPDTEIRIFAIISETDETLISEQILYPIQRKGFTVVEWGGSIITQDLINL